MSFNLVLFVETIVFLGAAELWMVESGRAGRLHVNQQAFTSVPLDDFDVELGGD